MKVTTLLHISGLAFFLLAVFATGCSKEDTQLLPPSENSRAEIQPLLEGSMDNNKEEILEKLQYKLYYFRCEDKTYKPEETESGKYSYRASTSHWLDYDEFRNYIVNIGNEYVEKYYYRLIAIATPAPVPEIEFSFAENESDSLLTNLYLRRTFNSETNKPYPLSLHNYIGVGNLTAEAIKSGIIPIEFRHAIGQLVFDFSRVDNSGSPLKLDEGYSSTLDRVKQIDVQIENYTRSLKWDMSESNIIIGEDCSETCSYFTSRFLDDGDLKVDWSKATENSEGKTGWISPGTDVGSTRFYGPCLLASDPNKSSELKVKLTFYYADTYLPDGEDQQSTISLSLPREGNQLTIKTGNYTVTTVKILENRIIDVPKDFGGITINTGWDNGTVTP